MQRQAKEPELQVTDNAGVTVNYSTMLGGDCHPRGSLLEVGFNSPRRKLDNAIPSQLKRGRTGRRSNTAEIDYSSTLLFTWAYHVLRIPPKDIEYRISFDAPDSSSTIHTEAEKSIPVIKLQLLKSTLRLRNQMFNWNVMIVGLVRLDLQPRGPFLALEILGHRTEVIFLVVCT